MPDSEAPQSGRAAKAAPLPAPGRVKEVTSPSNPIVKDIRLLAQKKHRDETGLFLAEGLKLVLDALEAGWRIRTLVISKAADTGGAVGRAAARTVAAGADVLEASNKVLEAITRRENPQGVVGVFERRLTDLSRLDVGPQGTIVVLDRVRDPGNLGTILRTADAAGASGVVLVGDCVDPFSLEAVRATMGSIFAVPLARASEESFLAWRRGFRGLVAGTHMKGETDYRTASFAGRPVALLMGNEQSGLTDRLAESCDVLLRIPQAGRADSLNLAVATALVLFEARRGALVL